MKTMKRSIWLCASVTLLFASVASAQVPAPAAEKFYLNVNGGAQVASRTLGTSVTKTVYDEPATVTSEQPIGKGGLFDVSVGYRVYGDIYVGLAVSRFADSSDAAYTASVPDPVVFNRFRQTTGVQTALDRTELSFNPNISWVTPLTDKLDVSLGVGAAFIQLTQMLPSDFTVPPGTQRADLIISEEKATAKGFYGNLDLIYSLAERYGVGGFVRYSGGKVDLVSSPDHNVGGVQVGGGIRLRF